jgi:putative chitinase
MLYTPEEIRSIYDEYQRRRALNIPITEEFARQLRDAAVGVKNYTNELEASLNQLKSSGIGLFNALRTNQQGASVFNDTIRATGDATAVFAKRLGRFGGVVGLLAKAGAAYIGAANEQSDALFNGYTELTQFGAGFDTGLDGVFRVNQQLGYSIAEMSKFVNIIDKNRQVFPMFRGTVTQGVKAFGDVTDSLRGYEYEFRMMGLSLDDVNNGVANFLQIQTMTGRSQTQSLAELSRGAYQYIQQQTLLTRLTGETADAQRTVNEQMANNAVFQAVQRDLRVRRQAALAAGDTDEAARLEEQARQNIKAIQLAPEPARKGLMEAMGGFVGASEDVEKSMMLMPEATRMAMEQRHSAIDIIGTGSQEADDRMNRFLNSLGRLGLFEDYFGSVVAARRLSLMGDREVLAAREAAVLNEMAQQKNLKDETSSYVKMQMEQRRTREGIEDFINVGINATTAGMRMFAQAANAASDTLTKTAGVGVRAPGAATTEATAAATAATTSTARAPRRAGSGPTAARRTTSAGATPTTIVGGSIQQQIRTNLAAHGITDPMAVSNILAQIQAESNFVPRSEDLNYSGSKLFELYGPNQTRNRVRFRTLAEANALAAQGPEAVGNVIYGGRMGNAADEGFKYRGRGLVQLTGKDNYRYYSELIGVDLVSNPDQANDLDTALKIVAAYFAEKNRSGVDLTNISAVGRAVGYAGGANETARRAQMAESFMLAMGPTSGYRFGGVATGPDSDLYEVELHGTEAVVPLPDGRGIPVEMPNYATSIMMQTEALTEQTQRLNQLISVMRTRNQISQKILRAYQS